MLELVGAAGSSFLAKNSAIPVGSAVMMVRPETIELRAEKPSKSNIMLGRVDLREFLGATVSLHD
jgi:hypothetical protein